MAHAHCDTYAQSIKVNASHDEVEITCGLFTIRMKPEEARQAALELNLEAVRLIAQQMATGALAAESQEVAA